jgi:hypothetical protein
MTNIKRLFVWFLVVTPALGQGRDPKPEDAARAIIAAFDTFRIVALGDRHGTKDLNDFTLSLVRHPAFPNAVNDIVIECTSASIQSLLDRYIAGEDLPSADIVRLWRDQTHPPCSVEPFHERLLQVIRRVNQALAPGRRLRVLAGEAPLDWRTLTPETHRQFMDRRETHVVSVLETEVMAKGRKALILYGGGHLNHGVKQMAMGRFEEKHPGVTFVIALYAGARAGVRCGAPAVVDGRSIEARMTSWPVPSLARTKGTWLADFARTQFMSPPFPPLTPGVDPIDAFLYLGRPDLLLGEPPSVYAFLDKDFIGELQRRGTVMMGGNYRDDRLEADKVRERALDSFICEGRSGRPGL